MSHESIEKLEDRILMTQSVNLSATPAPGLVYGPITAPTNGAAAVQPIKFLTKLTPVTPGQVSFASLAPVTAAAFTPEAANQPIGVAKGINAGRVTWAHDAAAVNNAWSINKPATGYWWEDKNNNQPAVNNMVGQTVRWLTGQSTDVAAWNALFRSFNLGRGAGNVGYVPGQKIVIKVNLNNTYNFNKPATDPSQYQMGMNNWADSSPQSIYALIYQLKNAGVREQDMYFIEPGRYFVDRLYNPLHAAFPAVHFVDRLGINGREKAERTATPVLKFANGKQAFIPQLYADATYLINLAPLKKHELAGFTCVGKNQYGAIWTTDNAEFSPISVHTTLAQNITQTGAYTEMTDINGSPQIGGKTMLYMIDALWGGWYSNGENSRPLPFDMSPFYGNYPASMFASQDFVAIESVALDFIRTEDALHNPPRGSGSPVTANADNTLHESALANNPGGGLPAGIAYSGTVYKPDGVNLIASLGTHEHWNNATARQYSRNLGTGAGIELVADQAPTNLALSRTQIPDNLAVGATVGTLSTTDYNAASTFTYSLVPGAGSTDNASFAITNNQLQLAAPLSAPVKSTYAILLRTTDPFGLYFEKALTITVTDATGPTVAAFLVNGGSSQRSMVTQMTLTFAEAVSLAGDALVLQFSDGSPVLGVTLAAALSADQKTCVITFSGAAVSSGSLADGSYKIVVRGSGTRDLAGNAMAGDQNFTFHRLFGDGDGDGTVTSVDLAHLRRAYGLSAGETGFDAAFDFDGDGVISSVDLAQLRRRYGVSVV